MSNRITLLEAVSPYDKDLMNNIEPRMRPIVKMALDYGLFPVSSCEGHGNLKQNTAYITFAFPSITEAKTFASRFKSNRCIVNISSLEDECNVTKEQIEEDPDIDHVSLEHKEAVKYFNKLFLRSYQDYFFVKIKYYRSIFLNKYFMNRWFQNMEYIMTQTRSQRIQRDKTARSRRSKTKDILYTKTKNFFRKERWIKRKKQKSVN
jgi:hypothetical protein